MTILRLFTDGSVDPGSKIGYGAYLAVSGDARYSDIFKADVQVRRFEQTSSTRLEIQTLIWALSLIPKQIGKITVYTDSQNIIGLGARRSRLENSHYLSKKNRPVKNRALYQQFFFLSDQLNCIFEKVEGHKPSRMKTDVDRFFTLVDRASRQALRQHDIASDRLQD